MKLKLTDIEAYLMTFETVMEAHGVEKVKWPVILAPGKALQTYAAMSNDDSKDFDLVKKEAIFQQYDINEMYRQV